ncbi:hypothetical protein G6F57_001388 [Rhizopus arrhizus]|nr:hypothetical protein G6F30_002264 [Rhizopus arrhizus]KAG1429167.1 hypothetical protein G6F58_000184 [Rhizopus delemar]KAG0987951.1 hypothetical protein G6F29_002107 [Rhizopus arrhizus]KAG0998584.1 hypothetical protein G6F28_001811 [Rhizopus arrhizus]KAG1012679.1 hypothetical protein G6F27_002596 [Rhizopus arrhizus]
MTIYYTLTFGIMVTEMVLFGLLVLPLPSRWRHAMLTFALKSPQMANVMYTFKIAFGFIFILFIDTINRLQRIESEARAEQEHHHDHEYEISLKTKKFYSQRNLYLTGFTLFLSVILERTSALVLELVKREEELKHTKSKTAEVTEGQQRLINMESDYKKQVEALNTQIKELKRQNLDYETLKKQAAQQQKEFDRLATEYNELESSLGTSEAKKDL